MDLVLSANYMSKQNCDRRHVLLNFHQHIDFSSWNGLPSENTKFKMFILNQDDPRKIHVCYICKELGHYANNCPNPRKLQDCVHLSTNCKTT